MILLVGLGNPGKQYEHTYHNLGFRVIDAIYKNNKDELGPFSLNKKFHAETSSGNIGIQKVVLAKPQTFMNNSGKAVSGLAKYLKVATENIWVIHDELDLELFRLKIAFGAQSAGHLGVQSVMNALNSQNFVRFRLGTKTKELENMEPHNYVLSKIGIAKRGKAKNFISEASDAVIFTLQNGLQKAMAKYNRHKNM